MLQALIFDVDGTLADTEAAHRAAFNLAFAEHGLDWHWDEALYTELLAISGGKERIQHYWNLVNPDAEVLRGESLRDTVDRLHERKTVAYEDAVNGGAIDMRPGVLRLMDEALSQGLRLAIATTTSPVNIAALLRRVLGSDWRSRFFAIGDAATAPIKKPHPQVYLQTLAALGVPARACIAFEDSSNGLRASTAAQLATVVTPTSYTQDHDFSAAMCVLADLADVDLAKLRSWHTEFLR
jgi:HAD superfamily hydrolase (TIGR01509 family)